MPERTFDMSDVHVLAKPEIPPEILKAIRKGDLAALTAFFQGCEAINSRPLDYQRNLDWRYDEYRNLGITYATLASGGNFVKSAIENVQKAEYPSLWSWSNKDRQLANPTIPQQDLPPKLQEMVQSLQKSLETGEIREVLSAIASGYKASGYNPEKIKEPIANISELGYDPDRFDIKTFEIAKREGNESYVNSFQQGFNFGRLIREQIQPLIQGKISKYDEHSRNWYRDFYESLRVIEDPTKREEMDSLMESELPGRYENNDFDMPPATIKPEQSFNTDFEMYQSDNASLLVARKYSVYGPPWEQVKKYTDLPKVYFQPNQESPFIEPPNEVTYRSAPLRSINPPCAPDGSTSVIIREKERGM